MAGNINEHLVSVGDWGAQFRCTPVVLETFKRRKVFFWSEPSGDDVLTFNNDVILEPYTTYFPTAPLWSMGSFSYSWSPWGGARIGRYCSIAGGCSPISYRHPIEWATSSFVTYYQHDFDRPWLKAAHNDFNYRFSGDHTLPKPTFDIDITIGNDVWIGENVRLAHQLIIGTGSVVATGAIVTRNVEPYMIVGGVPARVIRPRFKEKLIEEFLESKWWEFGPNLLSVCDYRNPEKFLDDVAKVREEGSLSVFFPEPITFREILNDLMGSL